MESDSGSDEDGLLSTSNILKRLGFRNSLIQKAKNEETARKICKSILSDLIDNIANLTIETKESIVSLPTNFTSNENLSDIMEIMDEEGITLHCDMVSDIISNDISETLEIIENATLHNTGANITETIAEIHIPQENITMLPECESTVLENLSQHVAEEVSSPTDVRANNAILDENIIIPFEEEEAAVLQAHEQNAESVAPKKKLKSDKDWQRNVTKRNRMLGQPFKGYRREDKTKTNLIRNDVFKSGRSMGPPCSSETCAKVKTRKCHDILEPEREKIFQEFWKSDWQTKKTYVRAMVDFRDKKRPGPMSQNPGSKVKYFHLKCGNGERIPVCMQMFLNTLGIKQWTMRYWLENHEEKKHNTPRTYDEDIHKFLDQLPKMPSHYCRASSNKLYLETVFENKNQLYKVYKQKIQEENKIPAGKSTFNNVFKAKNIGIFKPRKDQCDTCTKYKVKTISEEEYKKHIEEKTRAQEEKKIDKEKAMQGLCHVLAVDVQAVKLAPFLQASAMYFKTKLQVHNYSVYNLLNGKVCCYWFSEIDADLSASTFASFLVDILQEVLDEKLLPVIIYSDGCPYQNRNAVLANALLHLSVKLNVKIEQKYLVKGHTQMEVDSVHSTIERKLKNKEIHLPSDYAKLTRSARTRPFPYETKLPDYSFFKNYCISMVYNSIKPVRGTGVYNVVDIRSLLYNPNGTIMFKIRFDDEYEEVPQRRCAKNAELRPEFPRSYYEPLKISKSKYDHLQELTEFIPADCRQFYNNLKYV